MAIVIGLTLLTAIVATWGILKAASKRRDLSGAFLGLILTCATWWALCYVMETQELASMRRELWGGPLKYLGLLAFGPSVLLHGLYFSGRGNFVNKKLIAALAIVPAIVLTVLIVPETRHLVRHYPADGDQVVLGPVYLLVLPHLLLTSGFGLWFNAQQSARMARSRVMKGGIYCLLIGAAMVTLLQVFTGAPFAWFDPAHTTAAGLLIAALWAVVSIRNNQQIVTAEETLEKFAGPLLLTDANRVVRDVNPAAEELLGPRATLLGRPLHVLIPGQPAIAPDTPCDGTESRAVVTMAANGQPRTWLAQRQAFMDTAQHPKADLLSLIDITDHKPSRSGPSDASSPSTQRPTSPVWTQTSVNDVYPDFGVELASRIVAVPPDQASTPTGDFTTIRTIDSTLWIITGQVRGGNDRDLANHGQAVLVAATTLLQYGLNGAEVLNALSKCLPLPAPHKYFVSMALIALRPSSAGCSMSVTLAGHNPVQLIRNGRLHFTVGDDAAAIALGQGGYDTQRVELCAGDRLVLVGSGQRYDLNETQVKVALSHNGPDNSVQDVTDHLVQQSNASTPMTRVTCLDYAGNMGKPVPSAAKPLDHKSRAAD